MEWTKPAIINSGGSANTSAAVDQTILEKKTLDRAILNKDILRHFEYSVLTAVSELRENAFPAEITRRLNVLLQRHVSLAQVFVALERLEDKGMVRSSVLWPEPVRGGRRRRVFQMEASGVRALRNTAAVFARVSSSGRLEEKGGDQYATS